MITSIVVDGCHNIKTNSANKIKVDDNILSVEKDIPFIRYRFNIYTENEYNYIVGMMNQFNRSTHLAEIQLNIETYRVVSELTSKFNNLVKYIYIDVTEPEVQANALTEDKLQLLDSIKAFTIDRIMLKDKSVSLDTICAKKMFKQIMARLGITEDRLGVCSSPLSFSDWACLTAVKARELMSIYSSVVDVALPSANHQCMNCCGCIRYLVVSADTEAPAEGKAKGGSTKKAESSENDKNGEKKKSSTKSSATARPGIYAL
jgi:hypothetical protein